MVLSFSCSLVSHSALFVCFQTLPGSFSSRKPPKGWKSTHFSSPLEIARTAVIKWQGGTLWRDIAYTGASTLLGFVLGTVIGSIVGLLFWFSRPVAQVAEPWLIVLNALPKLALAPVLVIWFGIGFQSKAFLVFLFSVFTILYNTVTGAKECKKEYLKVAKVFKANRFQTVFLVIIPAALPSIFNGLKLAAATALTGVLFSEMQSARAGLGYLLTESQNLLNTPRMFFLIILITLLSVGAVKLIDAIEYAISYRWRHV